MSRTVQSVLALVITVLVIPTFTSAAFATVEPQYGTLKSILGTVGLKFNPARSVLVSAHVIASLSDAGLRRRLTPVLGLDYSF